MSDLAALARSVFCVGFSGRTPGELPLEALRTFGPGGAIVFARNVGPQIRDTLAALRTCGDVAPLIAVDQEGGRVARFTAESDVAAIPCAMALAANDDPLLCEALGIRVGRDLARLGVSVNFAPCADLALDPRNTVIGARSFGNDPQRVAELSRAFARGLEAGGVSAAVKHFPGHGATAVDSHVHVPRIAEDAATFRRRDLVPFIRAVRDGVTMIMTAHIIVEAFDAAPATLSPAILGGILRDELGFDGIIVTDCLEMEAIAGTVGTPAGAVAALVAGADLLLVSHRLEVAAAAAAAIVDAIREGSLPLERLQSAAARVRRLRERRANPEPYAGTLDPLAPLAAARGAVTLVRGDIRLRAGCAVTVLSFEGAIGDGAAGTANVVASLSAALRARRWRSELMRVALEPQPDDIALLLAHIRTLGERNFVIIMRRAHLYPAQRQAVEAILAEVPDAIVVSAREPYDAATVPARNLACIYGDEAISLEGCADVLSGAFPATGRLPVPLDRVAAIR